VPAGGNVLTPRQYQAKWLRTYQSIATGEVPASGADPLAVRAGAACLSIGAGAAIDAPGGATLPVQGLPASTWDGPHHDYPAIDIMTPTASRVYAWRSGTVRNTHHFASNCFEGHGCDDTCGIGVTVVDATWPDVRWTYCHMSALAVRDGQAITAGQNVGLSGNTGHSGAPHLHLEIRIGETKVCPQPALRQILTNGQTVDPHSLPTAGCFF